MDYVYPALLGLLSIASFVVFIMVLIRSFKDGGILHGLLGLRVILLDFGVVDVRYQKALVGGLAAVGVAMLAIVWTGIY